jgi:ubiquitin C-terminal hydrolase
VKLLDVLQSEVGTFTARNIITDLFAMELQDQFVCRDNNAHTSQKKISMYFLSLDLPGLARFSLGTHFASFGVPEVLDGRNKCFCEQCEKKVRATKLTYWILFPQVLVIHLKRFRSLAQGVFKCHTQVDFETTLKVHGHLSGMSGAQSVLYQLTAMVCHQGQWAHSGHYVAYVLREGKWYCCNDKKVKE